MVSVYKVNVDKKFLMYSHDCINTFGWIMSGLWLMLWWLPFSDLR